MHSHVRKSYDIKFKIESLSIGDPYLISGEQFSAICTPKWLRIRKDVTRPRLS
jgi:hypothetical protein